MSTWQQTRLGFRAAGAGALNSSFALLAVAMLAIGLDVGVARITYGVVLPAGRSSQAYFISPLVK